MGERDAAGARPAGDRYGPPVPGTPEHAAGGPGQAGAAGVALAVVAAGGTALGAVLLRPDRSLPAKSGGPLDNTAAVILVALACLGGGLLLSSRYRARVGHDQVLPPFEQRLTDVVRVALLAAAVLIPALLLAMHRFPESGRTLPSPQPTEGDIRLRTPPPPPRHTRPLHSPGINLPHVLVVIGVIALVAVLLVAGHELWRQLHRAPVEAAAGTYHPAEEEVLADAVDSGRRALLGGTDARAAVIACYAAMETSLARSGVARRASDTPQELLERASGSGLPSGPHATVLTALFREARYSTHPMDRTHRDRAACALDAIAAQLAERAESDGNQPGDSVQPTVGGHR